jgi:rubrerythrin
MGGCLMYRVIRTLEDFYAHAIAIEREACERYREFEAYFSDRGEEVLAGLCRNLAAFELKHYGELIDKSRNLTLPAIAAGEYSWLEEDSPESAARELFYRATNPRQVLEIALEAERRARRFFHDVEAGAPDEGVRSLAGEMAREEDEHVRWVTQAIQYLPAEGLDWDQLLRLGGGPGLALGAERRLRRDPRGRG